MIHRAKFQNFKALRDVEITFDSRLTVLVGPNGSGKTSVLKGIELLGSMAAGKTAREVFSGNFAPEVTWSGRGDEAQSLSVTAGAPDGSQIVTRMVATKGTIENPQPWKMARELFVGSAEQLQPLSNSNAVPNHVLQNVALLKLDPSKIAAASSVTQVPPSTGSDGTGTASTLAYLHRKQAGHFAQAVILYAARSETSSNSWNFRVINEANGSA
jgi:energy-coupling factor transporter ATP-binding protein EcfA2